MRRYNRELTFQTNDGLFSKDYGLSDQIRRASVSIMSNIAEGFEVVDIKAININKIKQLLSYIKQC